MSENLLNDSRLTTDSTLIAYSETTHEFQCNGYYFVILCITETGGECLHNYGLISDTCVAVAMFGSLVVNTRRDLTLVSMHTSRWVNTCPTRGLMNRVLS